jgi:hypothetical protein
MTNAASLDGRRREGIPAKLLDPVRPFAGLALARLDGNRHLLDHLPAQESSTPPMWLLDVNMPKKVASLLGEFGIAADTQCSVLKIVSGRFTLFRNAARTSSTDLPTAICTSGRLLTSMSS